MKLVCHRSMIEENLPKIVALSDPSRASNFWASFVVVFFNYRFLRFDDKEVNKQEQEQQIKEFLGLWPSAADNNR